MLDRLQKPRRAGATNNTRNCWVFRGERAELAISLEGRGGGGLGLELTGFGLQVLESTAAPG
jgi:hypothetical protein